MTSVQFDNQFITNPTIAVAGTALLDVSLNRLKGISCKKSALVCFVRRG